MFYTSVLNSVSNVTSFTFNKYNLHLIPNIIKEKKNIFNSL